MKKLLLFSALTLGLFQAQSLQAQNCSAPTITTFTPNTGFIGSIVTIKGSNFDANAANDQVFFGATQAQVLSASFGSLTVKVPVGTTYAPITVKNGCGLIGVSSTSFNAIFCPTTITAQTYNTVSYSMNVSGGYQMISQDMDLDGKPDILACGFTTNQVSIARNMSTPGNFNFAPKFDLPFSGMTRCIAPADFDGDGKIDLAVVDNGIDGIKIYRNTSVPGSLSFDAPFGFSANGAYQVTAGDLNGDGKLDIACTAGSNVRTFLNTSTGVGAISFSANTVINNTYYATGIAIVDVDGDGTKDIGTSCPSNDLVTAIKNTTTGGSNTFTFGSVNSFATGSSYPYRLFVGDFDKDGKIDFVTNNFSGATTSVFRNTSAGSISFAAPVNLSSPTSNYRLGVGDADGDGKPDLVTKSSGENLFSVYVNTSTGAGNISFASRIDYPGQAEVSGILIADLDLDFVPDIATSGISYNELRVHRNKSSVTDNTPPTAICKNAIIGLDPSGNATLTADMVDNGSSDACGIQSITVSKTAFTCAEVGENTVVLTVTDRAGNVSTCSAVVTVAPAAIVVAGQSSVCAGQTVALSANLGDTYQWFKNGVAIDGATTQNYSATTTGAYSVEVTNAGGCSGVSSAVNVTVGDAPQVTTSVSGTTNLCQGNTVTISASAASSYKWNTGSTASSITVGAAGSYSVTVFDDNGCSSTSAPVVVTVKSGALPTASISAQGATTFCEGGNVVITSAENHSYLWSNGATTQSITTTSAGSYSVTVTNADGCFAVSSPIEVTVKPNPSVVASEDVKTCDRAVQLNAVGNSNGVPNVPVYTKVCLFTSSGNCNLTGNICSDSYAWINSTNWSATQTTSGSVPMSMDYNMYFTSCGGAVSFNLKLNGVLLQTVTNTENSCTCTPATYPWKISIPSSVYASAWNTSGVNTYSIEMSGNSLAVTGMTVVLGFPGSSYSWSPAAGLDDASSASVVALPVETTDYVVTYTSANGCTATDTTTVTVSCNTAPVAVCKALTLSTDSSCTASASAVEFDGGSTDAEGDVLSFSVAPQGPYAIGTTEVVLTVTDPKGLSSSCATTVTVADNSAPVVLAQNLTVQLDENGQASITAEQVNNGSSDACGIASIAVDKTSFDCSNVGANTVTLTVVDVNGNASSAEAVVTVEDKINPTIVCGGDVVLTADRNDCTPVVTWNTPVANDNCSFVVTSSHNSGDRFAVGTTLVTYTVTDASGNTNTCSFNVVVNATPLVASTTVKSYVGGYNVSCNGKNDGEASVSVDGGCLPYSYVWNTIPAQTTATATGLAAGTYSVTVTDANNQTTTQTVTLTQPAVLVAEAGNNATVFYGYSPSACATLNGSAVGGNTAYSYAWSNGANAATTTVCPNVTTVYTLTVTDVNGCVATDKVSICAVDVRCEKGGNAIIKGKGDKVMICHNASGKFQTLCVAADAVAAHLAHGDKLGECGTNLSCFSSFKTDDAIAYVEESHSDATTVVAYPNPFSSTTTIEFTASADGTALIQIVDMKGALVANLYNGNTVDHQVYRFNIDGSNLQDGIYFVRVITNDQVQNVKLVLAK